MNGFKRTIAYVCAVLLMLTASTGGGLAVSADPATAAPAAGETWYREGSYGAYLHSHATAARPTGVIRVEAQAAQVTPSLPLPESLPPCDTLPVLLEEGSAATWEITVEQAGLYALGVRYCPVAKNGQTVECALTLNGEQPFEGAAALSFSRQYAFADTVETDRAGNDVRPSQSEVFAWTYTLAGGAQEYCDDPYLLYFSEGVNTLTLTGRKEALAIAGLELTQPADLPDYATYLRQHLEQGAVKVRGEAVKVQAEAATRRSDRSITMQADRTSPLTEPLLPGDWSVAAVKLNSLGGQNWRYPRQWIEWTVEVPESGLYRLGLRYMQSWLEGISASRRLLVNGAVPFAEADELSFAYRFHWQSAVLGDENGDWYVYLEKGQNTLRLEATVGSIGEVVQAVQQVVSELNTAYRRILMITGASPDANRDYNLDKELPECMTLFSRQSALLLQLAARLEELSGGRGSAHAQLQKVSIQLADFVKDPDSIPERMDTFRSNISDLASWMLGVVEQPLLLDYLLVMTEDSPAPAADANWWGKLVYELTNFMLSFVTDYSAVSGDAEAERSIELWMGTSGLTGAAQTAVTGASGRDQAQVLKTLIGDTFTPKSGVEVDIRLVDMTVLLSAVASGNGPDVAINQEQTNPVNYALRGALYPLSAFADHGQVLERFAPSAAAPFWLEGALYALPETQVFSMLFYRTDILQELGLDVPRTWAELRHALTVLNRHNLEIGLPNLSDNNLDVFYMLLYQYGGSVYNDALTATALGSEQAITAFTDWAELYTKYNVSQKMDALTRFRTGEVPVMISPFTFFNTLSASAPEIKGAWAMAPLPGTATEDGMSRAAVSASTGAVIFRNATDAEASWEFLKWWTAADTQSAYGGEMEILMGEAARWPTANTEAFRRMAWKTETLQSILTQKEAVHGLPEVPGGYMTNRYVATAIRLVINNGLIPREAILDYSLKIDEEIRRKRWEFGMV